MMHNLIFLLLASFLFYSCHNESHLFEGKYVKGTIVAKAVNDDYGFLRMYKDHDYSYLAMYKGLALNDENLNETYFFKVKEIAGVPWAYDFKDNNSSIDEYTHDPITKIKYHSFTQNDHLEFIHKKIHMGLNARLDMETGNEDHSYEVAYESAFGGGSGIDTLHASNAIKERIDEFGYGTFFIEVENDVIIAVDTCHYHGTVAEECRN